MAFMWYAIQTYGGKEMVVKDAIEKLADQLEFKDKIKSVVVPTEDVIEVGKNKKQAVKERSLYPGYCFANLELDNSLWHKITVLPNVGRFIGEANKPAPLSDRDINLILEKVNKRSAPKPKISFSEGEVVRIVEGPFANFNGIVEEYDISHGRLRLNVSIFGRNTPVEIMYSQVEKIV